MKRFHCYIVLLLMLVMPSMVFAQPTIRPMAYGGKTALDNLIKQEMVYPLSALQDSIEGKVILSFMVTEDGSTLDMKVYQSADSRLNAEAIRLWKLVLWEPALSGSDPIMAQQYFEVDFKLKKYRKLVQQRGYHSLATPYTPVNTTSIPFHYAAIDESPKMVFNLKDYSYEQFLEDNLEYPKPAYRNSTEGVVVVSFIIEPHGRITNIKVKKDLGSGCSKEAIRLIKLLSWYPGIHKKTAVRTYMEFAVQFVLPDIGSPKNLSPAK